jgi:hypothetical protein
MSTPKYDSFVFIVQCHVLLRNRSGALGMNVNAVEWKMHSCSTQIEVGCRFSFLTTSYMYFYRFLALLINKYHLL